VARHWQTVLAGNGEPPPTLGVGGPSAAVGDLRDCYDQAVRSVGILLALGHRGRAVTTADLGLFGVIFGHGERDDLQGFLATTLGAVVRWDERRNGALLVTLEAFFAESGHLANTAARLNIHVNTLYQRLERLDQLLGDDWRTPDRQLEVHLATRLKQLDARLRRGGDPDAL
jgi:DNA-binding PucR family transcriptional regulator